MKIIIKLLSVCALGASLHASVLIQGAMDVEIQALKAAMQPAKLTRVGSWEFYEGRIGAHDVVLSKTLIGLSNAAAATAIGIEKFHPRLVINQGTAGGIAPGVEFGRIIVGERIYNAGAYKSRASEQSMDVKDRLPLAAPLSLLDAKGAEQKHEYFTSTPRWLERAQKVFGAQKMTIASADAFNQQKALLAWWHELYGAQAEEMESVAAAQVAAAFGVDFLALRIISDNLADDVAYDPSVALRLQEELIRKLDELLAD